MRRATKRASNRIRKTTTKATGAATRGGNSKTTTSTSNKRQNVRTRAGRAANTRVQTAPASRPVGTKATLNGKPVFWSGKEWLSKTNYQNTVSGKTARQNANRKPNTTSVSKSSGTVPTSRGTSNRLGTQSNSRRTSSTTNAPTRTTTRRSEGRTGTVTPRTTASQRQEIRAAQNQRRRANADKTKTTASKRTTEELETGSRVTSTNTSASDARRKSSKNEPTKRPTKAEQVRDVKSNLRDRGAKSVVRRTPKNSADTAQEARGNRYSASRGGSEPIDARKSERSRQQNLIRDRVAKERGAEGKQSGRNVRLSAADARQAADKYEVDKMKEITKKARTLEGREASNYMKQAKKEMKREAASIRKNARTTSLTTRNRNKNNESTRSSYQEPNKLSLSRSNRRSLSDEQRRGERLSADMQKRRNAGQLKPTKSMDAKPGIDASKSVKPSSSRKPLTGPRPAGTGQWSESISVPRTPSNKTGRPATVQTERVPESNVVGTRRRKSTGEKVGDIKRTTSAAERRQTRLNADYDSRTTREQVTRERGQRALNAERRNSQRIMQGNQEQFNRFNGR